MTHGAPVPQERLLKIILSGNNARGDWVEVAELAPEIGIALRVG